MKKHLNGGENRQREQSPNWKVPLPKKDSKTDSFDPVQIEYLKKFFDDRQLR
ncbi:MAG: hypothetical protein LBF58_08095 [Deltaproteobacteria bacterium]|nr:hypothetical protein [Deltaproteobacteria bacterium]